MVQAGYQSPSQQIRQRAGDVSNGNQAYHGWQGFTPAAAAIALPLLQRHLVRPSQVCYSGVFSARSTADGTKWVRGWIQGVCKLRHLVGNTAGFKLQL